MKIPKRRERAFRSTNDAVRPDEKIISICKRIYHTRDGKTYEEEAGEGRAI